MVMEQPSPTTSYEDAKDDARLPHVEHQHSSSVLKREQQIEPLKTNFFSWFIMAWVIRFVRYFSAPASKLRSPIVALRERELAARSYEKLNREWQAELAAVRDGKRMYVGNLINHGSKS